MKTCEGISHYGYDSPYNRDQKPDPKELGRRAKYTLRRVKHLKREKDTFQLNKSLDVRLNENQYNITAFTENQNKTSLELSNRLNRTEEYTGRKKERPRSEHRIMIDETKEKLTKEGKENKSQRLQLANLLQLKRKEEISIRNKWQDTRHYSDDSNRIMITALRTSDINFMTRREAESVDKDSKRELENIILLRQEAKILVNGIKKEMKRNEELEKETSDTYRDVLEKLKKKKELEDLIKRQDAYLRNLNSKIQSLMNEEKGFIRLIDKFVENTS